MANDVEVSQRDVREGRTTDCDHCTTMELLLCLFLRLRRRWRRDWLTELRAAQRPHRARSRRSLQSIKSMPPSFTHDHVQIVAEGEFVISRLPFNEARLLLSLASRDGLADA
jgi:hypothetical protein